MELLLMIILFLAMALAFYMAWNIGANDVANSMSTAVGAKAISLRQAVIIAAILEFTGAVFVGSHVTETVRKGIIDPSMVTDINVLLLGMFASVLAASLWVTLATWKELPISTTHSIVGALLGFGIIAAGPASVSWITLGKVTLSWILSPIIGAIMAYIIFKFIIKLIFDSEDPLRAAHRAAPFLIASTFFIIVVSLMLKTNLGDILFGYLGIEDSIWNALYAGGLVAAIAGVGGFFLVRRGIRKGLKHYKDVELIFRRLQIMTSCYVAFAHGANDVANAIGPVATIYNIVMTGGVGDKVPVPTLLLIIGGAGISVGVATWGYKVIQTVGSRITRLSNTRGFSVDFSAATVVLVASKMGMPISTSHTVVGAVIGVGLARGIQGIDLRVIRDIVVSWVVTVPVAAITSGVIFYILYVALL